MDMVDIVFKFLGSEPIDQEALPEVKFEMISKDIADNKSSRIKQLDGRGILGQLELLE